MYNKILILCIFAFFKNFNGEKKINNVTCRKLNVHYIKSAAERHFLHY